MCMSTKTKSISKTHTSSQSQPLLKSTPEVGTPETVLECQEMMSGRRHKNIFQSPKIFKVLVKNPQLTPHYTFCTQSKQMLFAN